MNNFEILKDYTKGDLRRLAKGKISEIVGLDADKILSDLSKVLGNYESVKRNIEFRTPPTDTILEVLLDAPDYRIRTDDLKPAVKSRIQNYIDSSAGIDFRDPQKNFRLYEKMLCAAWDFDNDLIESEANLLRVLRGELGITRKEHQLVMAHPDVARLRFSAPDYEAALGYLTSEGLLLVYREAGDSYFILSDETADSLLQLWGFEMRKAQYERLLGHLAKPQLVGALKRSGHRSSGASPELVARIIDEELPPSVLLTGLSSEDLVGLLARLSLQKSGNKEERVLRLIDHFKSDADIAVTAPSKPVAQEVAPEPRVLTDEQLADLLDEVGTGQLAGLLAILGMMKSGSKGERIDRLVRSPFNESSMLRSLGLDELRSLVIGLGLPKRGNKPDLIEVATTFFATQEPADSPLTPKDLLEFYDELSRQDHRAYPPELTPERPSATRMGLDFERATRYIFKNLLRLDTKVQTAGREDPDGVITDESGSFFCYECKTVLAPPYGLPIQHRLQIRNYVSAIAKSRRAAQMAGYLIIANSFPGDIADRLQAIEPPLDIPIGVIEARDLLAFARKWQEEHPIDTYPIGCAMTAGRITAQDLRRAGRF